MHLFACLFLWLSVSTSVTYSYVIYDIVITLVNLTAASNTTVATKRVCVLPDEDCQRVILLNDRIKFSCSPVKV